MYVQQKSKLAGERKCKKTCVAESFCILWFTLERIYENKNLFYLKISAEQNLKTKQK